MKASEDNKVTVMIHLLDCGADIEAENNRGRTALSFAAAPSMIDSMMRPTAIGALELLILCDANLKHRDSSGLTAKDRARREKRGAAVRMLKEAEVAAFVSKPM